MTGSAADKVVEDVTLLSATAAVVEANLPSLLNTQNINPDI